MRFWCLIDSRKACASSGEIVGSVEIEESGDEEGISKDCQKAAIGVSVIVLFGAMVTGICDEDVDGA